MGGKKRGAPRQKQRAKNVEKEFQLHKTETSAGKRLESKQDEELFVIDNLGDSNFNFPNPKLKAKNKSSKQSRRGMPQQLAYKVKKIVETHKDNVSQIEQMAQAARKKTDVSLLKRQQRKIKRTNFDLWEDEGEDDNLKIMSIDPTYNPNLNQHPHQKPSLKMIPIITKNGLDTKSAGGTASIKLVPQTRAQIQNPTLSHIAQPSQKVLKRRAHEKQNARPSVAVDIALPGQSYLPDQEQHQDAIGEALTIEIRRKEAEEDKRMPIGGPDGMSEETLAILLPSDEESDSDEDDEDVPDVKFQPQKKPGKLTTSKRNKQKRARQQELASQARKKQKQILHSITEVKKMNKKLSQEEQERMEKKQVVNQLKQEELAKPLGTQLYTKIAEVDPIHVPSLPVALTEEIQRGKNPNDAAATTNVKGLYSLRTVKPKGSLMKERLESLADRKLANKRTLRTKRVVQGKKRKPGKGVDLFV